MLRGALKTMLASLLTALLLGTVVAAGAPADAVPKPRNAAPDCPASDVESSTRNAMAVFTGTVDEVEKQPRDDGQPGAFYLQTVTVTRVYQGRVSAETAQVRTDRNRLQCSLGELESGSDYMFFVSGAGEPWLAAGTSGTRPANDSVVAAVEALLGPGQPPVEPAPEKAVFTSLDVAEPQSLSRTAAPGAALVIVGLLGLALVRGLSRRSR